MKYKISCERFLEIFKKENFCCLLIRMVTFDCYNDLTGILPTQQISVMMIKLVVFRMVFLLCKPYNFSVSEENCLLQVIVCVKTLPTSDTIFSSPTPRGSVKVRKYIG